MSTPAQRLVALALAFQVGLVGAFGTGLHSLFGCSHGLRLACGAFSAECLKPGACCAADACGCGCDGDSPFERRREAKRLAVREADRAAIDRGEKVLTSRSSSGDCDGACSICDLLEQYHSATHLDSASVPLVAADCLPPACGGRIDANKTLRLADSRGPPVAALS